MHGERQTRTKEKQVSTPTRTKPAKKHQQFSWLKLQHGRATTTTTTTTTVGHH